MQVPAASCSFINVFSMITGVAKCEAMNHSEASHQKDDEPEADDEHDDEAEVGCWMLGDFRAIDESW